MLLDLDSPDTGSSLRTPRPGSAARTNAPEDATLLRVASTLARELGGYRPAIYWADFLLSALIGYATLALAILADPLAVRVAAGILSVLALYRAGSFIHEVSHMKDDDVPGFRAVWNALAGVPLMIPSFMYEGVHNLHHQRNRYGTARDPEYLPLAAMRPIYVPLFVAVALFGPICLLFRYAVLAPLSAVFPWLRTLIVERFSALATNPGFRREPPTGEERRRWIRIEAATSAWAIAVLAGTATGVIPLEAFFIYIAVLSGSMVLNQIRTLVAHLWENEGEPMSLTAQYLDSVNVPPPGLLPALWAPVGLRYHALHHLLPSLPYHALGKAHRALCASLPHTSPYHDGNYRSLARLIWRLVVSAGTGRR